MPQFKLEQLAIAPPKDQVDKAIELLKDIGLCDMFVFDTVRSVGTVFDDVAENEARLAFNYTALTHAQEFEVLHYLNTANWMEKHGPSASHFGMHVKAHELEEWKAFFADRNIKIAQEVRTMQHSNAAISGKRWYHYCIFDTRAILGIDLKFIVRLEEPR